MGIISRKQYKSFITLFIYTTTKSFKYLSFYVFEISLLMLTKA